MTVDAGWSRVFSFLTPYEWAYTRVCSRQLCDVSRWRTSRFSGPLEVDLASVIASKDVATSEAISYLAQRLRALPWPIESLKLTGRRLPKNDEEGARGQAPAARGEIASDRRVAKREQRAQAQVATRRLQIAFEVCLDVVEVILARRGEEVTAAESKNDAAGAVQPESAEQPNGEAEQDMDDGEEEKEEEVVDPDLAYVADAMSQLVSLSLAQTDVGIKSLVFFFEAFAPLIEELHLTDVTVRCDRSTASCPWGDPFKFGDAKQEDEETLRWMIFIFQDGVTADQFSYSPYDEKLPLRLRSVTLHVAGFVLEADDPQALLLYHIDLLTLLGHYGACIERLAICTYIRSSTLSYLFFPALRHLTIGMPGVPPSCFFLHTGEIDGWPALVQRWSPIMTLRLETLKLHVPLAGFRLETATQHPTATVTPPTPEVPLDAFVRREPAACWEVLEKMVAGCEENVTVPENSDQMPTPAHMREALAEAASCDSSYPSAALRLASHLSEHLLTFSSSNASLELIGSTPSQWRAVEADQLPPVSNLSFFLARVKHAFPRVTEIALDQRIAPARQAFLERMRRERADQVETEAERPHE